MDKDDSELQAIRARRLAELQQQHQGRPTGGTNQASQQQQEMKEKEDEMRNNILTQILCQEAGARLNTLKAVKPEKAKMVEDILINNARMGRLQGRLSESDLKDILERVNQQTQSKSIRVNIDRRRTTLDDDDDI